MQTIIQGSITLKEVSGSLETSNQEEKSIQVSKSVKMNYWRPEEQEIYLTYLKEHSPMINQAVYRKNQRIFKQISLRLRTRTPIQVKSHHQKLEQKYRTIPRIIAHLQRTLKTNSSSCEETQNNTCSLSPTFINQCGGECQQRPVELKDICLVDEQSLDYILVPLKEE